MLYPARRHAGRLHRAQRDDHVCRARQRLGRHRRPDRRRRPGAADACAATSSGSSAAATCTGGTPAPSARTRRRHGYGGWLHDEPADATARAARPGAGRRDRVRDPAPSCEAPSRWRSSHRRRPGAIAHLARPERLARRSRRHSRACRSCRWPRRRPPHGTPRAHLRSVAGQRPHGLVDPDRTRSRPACSSTTRRRAIGVEYLEGRTSTAPTRARSTPALPGRGSGARPRGAR